MRTVAVILGHNISSGEINSRAAQARVALKSTQLGVRHARNTRMQTDNYRPAPPTILYL